MEPSVNILPSGGAVIQGNLTIRFHGASYQILQDLFSKGINFIHIDMPEAIDLSFIQLLIAFMNSNKIKLSNVELQFNLNEVDSRLISNAGFSSLLKLKA